MSHASLLPAASAGRQRERIVVDHARQTHDWYVEPIWATELLVYAISFIGTIWDPCCGGGNVIKAVAGLAGRIPNHPTRASDLIDRGFGESGVDFSRCWDRADNIVFNPPYALAEEFITHAMDLADRKVAALVNLKFLASQARRKRLFNPRPPMAVLILSRRPSMPPGDAIGLQAKGGTADYCWIVWERGHAGGTQMRWLA